MRPEWWIIYSFLTSPRGVAALVQSVITETVCVSVMLDRGVMCDMMPAAEVDSHLCLLSPPPPTSLPHHSSPILTIPSLPLSFDRPVPWRGSYAAWRNLRPFWTQFSLTHAFSAAVLLSVVWFSQRMLKVAVLWKWRIWFACNINTFCGNIAILGDCWP